MVSPNAWCRKEVEKPVKTTDQEAVGAERAVDAEHLHANTAINTDTDAVGQQSIAHCLPAKDFAFSSDDSSRLRPVRILSGRSTPTSASARGR